MTEKETSKRDPTWAWVVLIGLVYAQALLGGTVRCFGIVYVDLLDVYGQGPLATGTAHTVYAVAVAVSAPISGLVSRYVSVRIIMFVSTVVTVLGFLGCALSPNLPIFIFFYGGLYGIGNAFIWNVSTVCCNAYFVHKRALANGLIMGGSSAGAMIMPFVFRFLIDTYTVRGTFFFIAGFWLQLLIVSVMLRPFSELKRLATQSKGLSIPYTEGDNDVVSKCAQQQNRDIQQEDIILEKMVTSDGTKGELLNQNNDIEAVSPRQGNDLHQCSTKDITNCDSENGLKGTVIQEQGAFQTSQCSAKENTYNDGTGRTVNQEEKETLVTTSHRSHAGRLATWRAALCGRRFLTLVMAWILATIGSLGTVLVIPAYVHEVGFTPTQASTLLAITAAVDLAGRLAFGAVGDWHFVDKATLVTATMATIGVVALFVPLIRPFWGLCIFAAILGLAGSLVTYGGPLMLEAVGPGFLSVGMGFISMGFGIGSIIVPLTMGGLKESTGTYSHQFQLSAAALFTFVLVFFIIGARYNRPMHKIFSRRCKRGK